MHFQKHNYSIVGLYIAWNRGLPVVRKNLLGGYRGKYLAVVFEMAVILIKPSQLTAKRHRNCKQVASC